MGDFHRSVEIAIFTDEFSPHIAKPFAIPKTVTHVFCNVQSNGRFSPIGGNRAIFTDEFSPPSQRPSQVSFPMFRAMGYGRARLGPEIPRKKNRTKSRQIRHRIASDVPNLEGWVAKVSFGAGGWRRPTLPRGSSHFCVCTSSAQCSDSFKWHVRALKAELNLPKLLHQALFAETPFSGIGGRKGQVVFVKPALVRQGQNCHFIHESRSWKCYIFQEFWAGKAQNCCIS